MIEAAQVRAARALIGWSQAELADAAGLPLSTVDRFETGAPDSVPAEAVAKMRAALELAGVAFIPKNGGGAGVRLARAARPNISAGTTSTPRTTTKAGARGLRIPGRLVISPMGLSGSSAICLTVPCRARPLADAGIDFTPGGGVMNILKTIRLVTIVSLALTSGCIVVARQADAKADIGYRQIPTASILGNDIVGLRAPQARNEYVRDGVRRVGVVAPVQRTYVTAGMSVERLRAPNAVWQIYEQRPKKPIYCVSGGVWHSNITCAKPVTGNCGYKTVNGKKYPNKC